MFLQTPVRSRVLITSAMVEYRKAVKEDLPGIAEVYLSAFPESIRHYTCHTVTPEVVKDIFAICLDSEPDALIVASLDGSITGYIFAPAHFGRLLWTAFLHGHLWRMLGKWVRRRYGFGTRPIAIALRNWLHLLRETRHENAYGDGRILSIAVDPGCQGHGIGSGLLDRGLHYLMQSGVKNVRLEVRPDNAPAKHLYEKHGFRPAGRTRDTQGEWLVMFKGLSSDGKT